MDENNRNFFLALDRDILAIQLLEVAVVLIQHIRKYAEENGIILGESPTLNRLLREAERLLYETNYVEQTQQHLKSRKLPFRYDDDENPNKLPEPSKLTLKCSLHRLRLNETER